jgi:hypothetical protein
MDTITDEVKQDPKQWRHDVLKAYLPDLKRIMETVVTAFKDELPGSPKLDCIAVPVNYAPFVSMVDLVLERYEAEFVADLEAKKKAAGERVIRPDPAANDAGNE